MTGNAAANLLSGRVATTGFTAARAMTGCWGGLAATSFTAARGATNWSATVETTFFRAGGRDRLEGREHNDSADRRQRQRQVRVLARLGHDRITDFSRSADDTLKFDASLWNDAHCRQVRSWPNTPISRAAMWCSTLATLTPSIFWGSRPCRVWPVRSPSCKHRRGSTPAPASERAQFQLGQAVFAPFHDLEAKAVEPEHLSHAGIICAS